MRGRAAPRGGLAGPDRRAPRLREIDAAGRAAARRGGRDDARWSSRCETASADCRGNSSPPRGRLGPTCWPSTATNNSALAPLPARAVVPPPPAGAGGYVAPLGWAAGAVPHGRRSGRWRGALSSSCKGGAAVGDLCGRGRAARRATAGTSARPSSTSTTSLPAAAGPNPPLACTAAAVG